MSKVIFSSHDVPYHPCDTDFGVGTTPCVMSPSAVVSRQVL